MCAANEFKCAHNKTCMSNSLKCNSENDCSDGSDEEDCRKFDFLISQNFIHKSVWTTSNYVGEIVGEMRGIRL